MTPSDDAPAPPGAGAQRLDKWLWFARIVKSRTLAASLIEAGRFRINRAKALKASALVKPGDVVTSSVQRTVRLLKVVSAGHRRGPPAEAARLYEEMTERSPAGGRREASVATRPAAGQTDHAGREPGSGRPTKRDRRQTDKLLGRP